MTKRQISETVSKKRGRPRVNDEFITSLRGLFPEVETRRGLQNIICETRAHGLIKDDLHCRWIVNPERARLGEKKAYRRTLLQALGRIPDDRLLRVAARVIARLQPRTVALGRACIESIIYRAACSAIGQR